jgi:K+-sensing histidine kinase KdpD
LAKNVFGADSCIIWEYNQAIKSFKPEPSTGLDTNWRKQSPRSDGIGAEVIERGEHLFVDDEKRLHDTARKGGIVCSGGFPLQLKGTKAIGVLYLHFRDNPHFTERDQEMVDLFSYNAGLAIRLAELREKSESRIKDLQVLRDANVAVAEARDLRESLKQVVKAAVRVMHAHAAVVYPYEEETGTFREELVIGEGIDMEEFEFQDPRLSGLIMERGEPLWEKDFEKVPKEREKLIKKLRGHVLVKNELRSFIGIALRSGEDKLGVLYVFFRKPHEPDADELSTISIFADLAATQIQLAKLSEAQRRAAEADEIALLNLVTAQFAHRLANVAGTIPLVVQDIEERLQEAEVTDDQIWSRLGDLKGDISRLLEMADYSRLRDIGRLVRVDLKSVVQEGVKGASLHLINPSIKVTIDIPDDLEDVMGVKALLVDILINLLQNAAQVNAKNIEIQAIRRGKLMDVIVSDDGDGIPEGETEKVFMPFYSRKKSGKEGEPHGRGLWVARHQIGQMGGRITARNRAGKGACFTVSLKKFNG